MSQNQKYWIAGLSILFLVLLSVLVYLLVIKSREDKKNNVDNFKECADAGNPILETYPEQCKTPNGNTFVNSTSTTSSNSSTSESTSSTSISTTTSSSNIESNVKVYFPKDPASMDDPTILVGVDRTTTRSDIATFAIENLITGPTESEQINGLFTPITFTGSSNCSGKDFSLAINSSKATIQFCKQVSIGGVMDGERIVRAVEKTLLQFSTVSDVVVLTSDGNCFNDLSGLNQCKN